MNEQMHKSSVVSRRCLHSTTVSLLLLCRIDERGQAPEVHNRRSSF